MGGTGGPGKPPQNTDNFIWAGMGFGLFEFLDLLFDNSALFVLRGEVLPISHVHDYWFQLREFPRGNSYFTASPCEEKGVKSKVRLSRPQWCVLEGLPSET